MRKRKITALISALAMTVSAFTGLAVPASAASVTYDFESGASPFNGSLGRVDSKDIVDAVDATNVTKVQKFSSTDRAQNGSEGANIWLQADNNILTAKFDFNIVGTAYVSWALGNAAQYSASVTSTGYSGSNNLSMHTGGTVITVGNTRQSGADYYGVNNSKTNPFTKSKWYHADISINYEEQKVTYSIYDYNSSGDYGSSSSISSGTADFMDKSVTSVDSLIMRSSNNSQIAYFDNVSFELSEEAKIPYTIEYQLEGETVVTTTGEEYAGTIVTAETSVKDEGQNKYYIIAEKAPTLEIKSNVENKLVVPVRNAEKYNIKVVPSTDSSKTITTLENAVEGESYTYYYHKYLTDEDNKVIASSNNSTYSGTVVAANNDDISVPYSAYVGTAYFFEAEDHGGDSAAITSGNLSNGVARRHIIGDGSQKVISVDVPQAGKYKVTVCGVTNKYGASDKLDIYKNDTATEAIYTMDINNSTISSPAVIVVAENYELVKGDKIIVKGNSANAGCDYVLLERTDDLDMTGEVTLDKTNPVVGDVLNAQTDGTPEGVELTYKWYRDSEVISNASGSTYTVTQDDVDHTIKVGVTAEGYTEVQSAPTAAVKKPDITDVSVTKQETLVYSGEPQELVKVTGTLESDTISYKIDGQPVENAEKTDAGTYQVEVTVQREGYNDFTWGPEEVTIAQSESEIKVTPDGESVEYGGSVVLNATVDIMPADVGADKIQFSVNGQPFGEPVDIKSGSASVTIPVTKDNHFTIGSNTIKAEYGGSANLNASSKDNIEVTVDTKELTYTATADSREYAPDNTTVTVHLTPTNKVGTDDVTLTATGSIDSADAGEGKTVTIKDVNIGGDDKDYYTAADAPTEAVTVTITKAKSSVSQPPTEADDLVADGGMKDLIKPGTATNGTMKYAVKDEAPTDDEYKEDIPQGDTAKTYKVWYKVFGTEPNYSDTEAASIDVTMTAPTPSPAPTEDPSTPEPTKSPEPTETPEPTPVPTIEGVTVSPNPDLTYTGSEQALVTVSGTDGNDTITYKVDKDNEVGEFTDNCKKTDAGTYTVTVKVQRENYQDWTSQPIQVEIAKAAPTVTPPTAVDGLTYTGAAQNLINPGTTIGGTLKYSTDETGVYSTTIPQGTEAKTYTVWYKVEGDDNYNDVPATSIGTITIAKAGSQVEVTDQSVTYGDTLTLTANVSRSPVGVMLASFEDQVHFTVDGEELGTADVTYSDGESKSTGTATFTYDTKSKGLKPGRNTIKAEYGGSVNLNGSNADNITVTLDKATLNYDVTATPRTYAEGNMSVDLTLTPKGKVNDNDDVTLTATGTMTDDTAGESKPVTVSDVQITGNDAGYYTAAEAPTNVTVNITKANSTVVAPTAKTNLTYTGEALELLDNKGSATGGELQYKVDEGTYSTDEPKATTAGQHTVYYKVVGNDNYNGIDEASITVEIAKATPVVTAPTAKDITYTGQEQELITAGKTTFGTLQYKVGDDGVYSTAIPKGTNAGTYTVYYKVDADTNWNAVAEQSVTATITAAKAAVQTAPTAKDLTYTGQEQELVTAGTAVNGTMQYSTDNQTWNAAIPKGTDAKDYTVWYKVVGDANYSDTDPVQVAGVTIKKATPTFPQVNAVSAGKYTPDMKLSGVEVPQVTGGTLAWKNGETTSLTAGANSVTAVFTPDKPENYEPASVEGPVTVNVDKADSTFPQVGSVTVKYAEGMTLAQVTPPPAEGGTIEWANAQTPVLSGTHEYDAVFKPTDTNYNDASGQVTVIASQNEPGTYSISGTVTGGEGTVKLELAGQTLESISADGGAYTFFSVAPGVYNMIVTYGDGKTITALVEVTDKDIVDKNIQIPAAEEEDNSSELKKDEATKDVVVGGLDELAGEEKAPIVMNIESGKDGEAQGAIKELGATQSNKMDFIDITITKDGKEITEVSDGLDIYIPFDKAFSEDSLKLYRYHGDDAEEIKQDKLKSDWFELIGKLIHIHATKFSTYAIAYDETLPVGAVIADKATIKFVQQGNSAVYDIVLYPDGENTYINRYMSAELTFDLTLGETTGSTDYRITAVGNSELTKIGDNKYGFNLDGITDHGITSTSVTIGRAEITAYGTYELKITDGIVRTAKKDNNIVHTYNSDAAAGENPNTLNVPNGVEESEVDPKDINPPAGGTKSPKQVDLNINVIFPNKVIDQAKEYMDMTINIDSAMPGSAKTIELGKTDVGGYADGVMPAKFTYTYADGITKADDGNIGGYLVNTKIEVPDGGAARYTISISGEGYRRYSKDIVVNSSDKAIAVNIWNNYMDEPMITVDPTDGDPRNLTFLAGDIIEDGKINLYDLSAGVSYFGKEKLAENPTENSSFIRYDLNRDGVIDSRDVAMILVSWGK